MQQAARGPRPRGHVGQWPRVPHRQSERRLHQRMPRDPRRFLAAGAACRPDARRRRPRARLSRYHRLRQRPRIHRPRPRELGARAGVELFFIDPGKPMQNGSIESFNAGVPRGGPPPRCGMPFAGRMPRSALAPQPGRGTPDHRALGCRLQRDQPSNRAAHVDAENTRRRSAVRATAASGSGSIAVSGLTAGAACRAVDAGAIPNGQIPLMSGPEFGAGSGASRVHVSVVSLFEITLLIGIGSIAGQSLDPHRLVAIRRH